MSSEAVAMNVLALVKGDQKYVFLYDSESYDRLLVELGNAANDDDLSFSWYDAAVLSQRAKQANQHSGGDR